MKDKFEHEQHTRPKIIDPSEKIARQQKSIHTRCEYFQAVFRVVMQDDIQDERTTTLTPEGPKTFHPRLTNTR